MLQIDCPANVRRYDPERLEDHERDIFITFALTFLSPGYVNNPFLKAKLVSVGHDGFEVSRSNLD